MSVCVSVTRLYCIKTAARIELFFAYRLPSTYATTYFWKIKISPKLWVLPFGTLFQILDTKIGHGMPTVGECDINSDSSQSVVCGATWRRRPKWQAGSTVNNNRRLLIALGVQRCEQRDG